MFVKNRSRSRQRFESDADFADGKKETKTSHIFNGLLIFGFCFAAASMTGNASEVTLQVRINHIQNILKSIFIESKSNMLVDALCGRFVTPIVKIDQRLKVESTSRSSTEQSRGIIVDMFDVRVLLFLMKFDFVHTESDGSRFKVFVYFVFSNRQSNNNNALIAAMSRRQ